MADGKPRKTTNSHLNIDGWLDQVLLSFLWSFLADINSLFLFWGSLDVSWYCTPWFCSQHLHCTVQKWCANWRCLQLQGRIFGGVQAVGGEFGGYVPLRFPWSGMIHRYRYTGYLKSLYSLAVWSPAVNNQGRLVTTQLVEISWWTLLDALVIPRLPAQWKGCQTLTPTAPAVGYTKNRWFFLGVMVGRKFEKMRSLDEISSKFPYCYSFIKTLLWLP